MLFFFRTLTNEIPDLSPPPRQSQHNTLVQEIKMGNVLPTQHVWQCHRAFPVNDRRDAVRGALEQDITPQEIRVHECEMRAGAA